MKCTRWMPWRLQAMKDVLIYDNFGELIRSIDPEISEWGNLGLWLVPRFRSGLN